MAIDTKNDAALASIWEWYPEKLTRFSSLWWFFLLFPQEKGASGAAAYGPRQIMLAIASRVGDKVTIDGTTHDGLRPQPMVSPFPAYTLAWIYSGQKMHSRVVHQAGTAQVRPGEMIQSWTAGGVGSEIRLSPNRPLAVSARFQGPLGGGEFEAWGDSRSEITMPFRVQRASHFGGADVVAWRRLEFAGSFSTPEGHETLSGMGYFQRVCLDIVPFPWKWVWALFADGSVLSCFIPYLGLHLLRRGNRFFNGHLENLTRPLQPSAYFWDAATGKLVSFAPQIKVVPQAGGALPCFLIHCQAAGGDYLQCEARPYAHHQVLIERPMLRGLWQSCYNYNEYLFSTDGLTGRLNRQRLDEDRYGRGFGNLEYTWGLGL
jgi:hypothetical protein